MKHQTKIYVGCSLTHAPEEFIASVEELKKRLSKTYEVFDFVGLTKGTARQIYQWDINRCVASCDLFVAICDHPSIGLGYELGTALEAFGKPVLAVAHKSASLSRLVQGIDKPHFSFKRYENLSDIEGLIEHKLMAVDAARC
jgi:hypothetical protein